MVTTGERSGAGPLRVFSHSTKEIAILTNAGERAGRTCESSKVLTQDARGGQTNLQSQHNGLIYPVKCGRTRWAGTLRKYDNVALRGLIGLRRPLMLTRSLRAPYARLTLKRPCPALIVQASLRGVVDATVSFTCRRLQPVRFAPCCCFFACVRTGRLSGRQA